MAAFISLLPFQKGWDLAQDDMRKDAVANEQARYLINTVYPNANELAGFDMAQKRQGFNDWQLLAPQRAATIEYANMYAPNAQAKAGAAFADQKAMYDAATARGINIRPPDGTAAWNANYSNLMGVNQDELSKTQIAVNKALLDNEIRRQPTDYNKKIEGLNNDLVASLNVISKLKQAGFAENSAEYQSALKNYRDIERTQQAYSNIARGTVSAGFVNPPPASTTASPAMTQPLDSESSGLLRRYPAPTSTPTAQAAQPMENTKSLSELETEHQNIANKLVTNGKFMQPQELQKAQNDFANLGNAITTIKKSQAVPTTSAPTQSQVEGMYQTIPTDVLNKIKSMPTSQLEQLYQATQGNSTAKAINSNIFSELTNRRNSGLGLGVIPNAVQYIGQYFDNRAKQQQEFAAQSEAQRQLEAQQLNELYKTILGK